MCVCEQLDRYKTLTRSVINSWVIQCLCSQLQEISLEWKSNHGIKFKDYNVVNKAELRREPLHKKKKKKKERGRLIACLPLH